MILAATSVLLTLKMLQALDRPTCFQGTLRAAIAENWFVHLKTEYLPEKKNLCTYRLQYVTLSQLYC